MPGGLISNLEMSTRAIQHRVQGIGVRSLMPFVQASSGRTITTNWGSVIIVLYLDVRQTQFFGRILNLPDIYDGKLDPFFIYGGIRVLCPHSWRHNLEVDALAHSREFR